MPGPEFTQWQKSAGKIATLDPLIQLACKDHIARCALEGIYVMVTEARRDSAYQATLYAKGRDAAGKVVDRSKVVTNAPPGWSVHEFGFAYDLAIDGVSEEGKVYGLSAQDSLIDAKVTWPNPTGKGLALWRRVVARGEAVGMQSGSTFPGLADWPHFQWLDGLKVSDLRAGKRPVNPPGWGGGEEFPLDKDPPK